MSSYIYKSCSRLQGVVALPLHSVCGLSSEHSVCGLPVSKYLLLGLLFFIISTNQKITLQVENLVHLGESGQLSDSKCSIILEVRHSYQDSELFQCEIATGYFEPEREKYREHSALTSSMPSKISANTGKGLLRLSAPSGTETYVASSLSGPSTLQVTSTTNLQVCIDLTPFFFKSLITDSCFVLSGTHHWY